MREVGDERREGKERKKEERGQRESSLVSLFIRTPPSPPPEGPTSNTLHREFRFHPVNRGDANIQTTTDNIIKDTHTL